MFDAGTHGGVRFARKRYRVIDVRIMGDKMVPVEGEGAMPPLGDAWPESYTNPTGPLSARRHGYKADIRTGSESKRI